MAKGKTADEIYYLCPVGKFFSELEKRGLGKQSKFREHIDRARVEFLKAIRSLLDERIDELEKRSPKRSGKKVTKIKVE
ncbi:MAG: hypothetical protein DRH12_14075 [Deltaproteobacteria bacterium]|nr:MAG: hypothetical protein DRH12_14075 [Deltaproteobacteria bacterium]RLB86090.1 MAG: hypothetical protein DRH15_02540 [Deltaproteobacteria bacterium]